MTFQLAQDAQTYDCRKAFADELIALAHEDERIVAVCNDSVGSSNLVGFREEFPERLINVGIAEQDLVGVGAGLANGGLIPFVSAAAPFLTGRAHRADQGRRRLQQRARHPLRPEPGHGVRRARARRITRSRTSRGCARSRTSPSWCPADPAQTRAAVRWAAGAGRPATSASRASRCPTSRRTAPSSSRAAPCG